MTDWLSEIAPYCGTTVENSNCPDRPGRWHMCVARPDHEHGETQNHLCGCGHAWITPPRVYRRARP